jgi:hypothetical protein
MIEDEEFVVEDAPNHGRGRCLKVTAVWKINMEEGVKELYCIAQNPKVASGIRERYREEAERYNIDPKYYITWEDRAVIWSRTVFPDRFRLINTDTNGTIWPEWRTNKTGEFNRKEGAKRMANRLISQGKLENYKIVKWNRQRKRWDDLDEKNSVKLRRFNSRGIK